MVRLRCAYCGGIKKVPEKYLKILSLFRSKYYFTCQYCHSYNCYGMYLRVYHDSVDVDEREVNRWLQERSR